MGVVLALPLRLSMWRRLEMWFLMVVSWAVRMGILPRANSLSTWAAWQTRHPSIVGRSLPTGVMMMSHGCFRHHPVTVSNCTGLKIRHFWLPAEDRFLAASRTEMRSDLLDDKERLTPCCIAGAKNSEVQSTSRLCAHAARAV